MDINPTLFRSLPSGSRLKLERLSHDREAAHGAVLAAEERYRAQATHAEALRGHINVRMRDHPEEHPQSENRLDMLAQLKAAEGDIARHRLAYDRARATFANFAFLDHTVEWLRSAVGTKRKLSRVKVEQIVVVSQFALAASRKLPSHLTPIEPGMTPGAPRSAIVNSDGDVTSSSS